MALDDQNDDNPVPLSWQDSIVKSGSISAILLALVFLGVAGLGLVRYPHWLWALPIVPVAAALIVNQRMRRATRYGQVAITGAVTLALLVAGGVALVLITRGIR